MELRQPLVVLAFVALAAQAWVSVARAGDQSAYSWPPEDPVASCITRYNALVLRAKKSLIGGDRKGAIQYLLAAKKQLERCRDLKERSRQGPVLASRNRPTVTMLIGGLLTPTETTQIAAKRFNLESQPSCKLNDPVAR
jgi:hypothetical protein